MDFLQQKEELESKINEINTYWKDLETTYQKEYKKDIMNIKKTKQLKKQREIYFIPLKNYYLS